jgi:hypothetical protein
MTRPARRIVAIFTSRAIRGVGASEAVLLRARAAQTITGISVIPFTTSVTSIFIKTMFAIKNSAERIILGFARPVD